MKANIGGDSTSSTLSYYQPRALFDVAIICIEDDRVVYDETKLLDVLIDDYKSTLVLLANYRTAPESVIHEKSRRLALQWIELFRDSMLYGDERHRPILR